MTAADWALARMVNEARVTGPVWKRERVNGRIRWCANQCRTHLGPLRGEGVVDMRVVEVRANCWMGQAFVWPTVEHRWDELRTVTVLPSKVKHAGWWEPEKAKQAMDDLLHGRPEAEELHVRIEPPGYHNAGGPPDLRAADVLIADEQAWHQASAAQAFNIDPPV